MCAIFAEVKAFMVTAALGMFNVPNVGCSLF
jgi:hypothetical protein